MTAEPSETRHRIIESAFSLFKAKGIDNTTTREIAQEADVNEVTLFRHFGTKDGLARAVLEYSFPGDMLPRLEAIDWTGEIETDFYLLTIRIVELHAEREDFFRFVFANIIQYPEHREFFGNMQAPMLQWLTDFLEPYCEGTDLDPLVIATEFIAPVIMRSIRRVFLDQVLIEAEPFARTHARLMAAALTKLKENSP